VCVCVRVRVRVRMCALAGLGDTIRDNI